MKDIVFSNEKKEQMPCTFSHAPLMIDSGKNQYPIWGASCKKPILKEADIYISLDKDSPVFPFEQPWNENLKNQQHIRYFIEDFSVPKNIAQFDALVEYTQKKLFENKKIHAGCISAHGRTGMFLSALTQKISCDFLQKNKISAIDYVRQNYCEKSVETLEQVFFLMIHYGVQTPQKENKQIQWLKKEFEEKQGVSFDKCVKEDGVKKIFDFLTENSLKNSHKKYKFLK